MKFEWDTKKDQLNLKKHGVSFKEASRLFTGRADHLELFDNLHSEDEDRFIAIGPIIKGIIVVVYIERDFDTIRIISARKATRTERTMFNNLKKGKK